MFNYFADIGFPGVLVYGLFCVYSIFSYSYLMDRSTHAWWIELVKSILGLILVFWYGGWFGLDRVLPGGTNIVVGYFALSFVGTLLFVVYEIIPEKQKKMA